MNSVPLERPNILESLCSNAIKTFGEILCTRNILFTLQVFRFTRTRLLSFQLVFPTNSPSLLSHFAPDLLELTGCLPLCSDIQSCCPTWQRRCHPLSHGTTIAHPRSPSGSPPISGCV